MTISYFLWVTLFCLLFFEHTNRGLEAAITDACPKHYSRHKLIPSVNNIKKSDYTCLLYPTHEINCSWSFQSLEKEAQITTNISVCDQGKTVQTLESKGPVGTKTCLVKKSAEAVVLYFNVSLHNKSILSYHKFDTKKIEVLSPPSNVTASLQNNRLWISWGRPQEIRFHPTRPDDCIVYEVQLRDQGELKFVEGELFYTEPVDPTQSFTVRVRTKIDQYCLGSDNWSNWSQPVKILSPPPNVIALFKDNDLQISWGRPHADHCSDEDIVYEVQLRDQEEPKYVKGELFYTEKVDPTQNCTVRIRAIDFCLGSNSWSSWSPVTSARKSVYHGTAGVITAISVGTPMILLAVLLLVCERVFKRLFPPIPSPPQKLLQDLQNSDAFVYPDLMKIPDEEITFVFYTEDNQPRNM